MCQALLEKKNKTDINQVSQPISTIVVYNGGALTEACEYIYLICVIT